MAEQKEIAVIYEIDGNEIKLTQEIVQRFLTGDNKITLPEFKFFTELCKVRKLNPFLKEAYLVKYGTQPAQIVVGKDVFLKRADKNPNYDGMEHGIIVVKADGTVEERNGTFRLKSEEIVGGWAKVFRKDRKSPAYVTVQFDEVAQHKGDGSLNSNWANKSGTMVDKVAYVRALREAFVEDFGGMLDEDELWDNRNVTRESTTPVIEQEEPLEVIDITL